MDSIFFQMRERDRRREHYDNTEGVISDTTSNSLCYPEQKKKEEKNEKPFRQSFSSHMTPLSMNLIIDKMANLITLQLKVWSRPMGAG